LVSCWMVGKGSGQQHWIDRSKMRRVGQIPLRDGKSGDQGQTEGWQLVLGIWKAVLRN